MTPSQMKFVREKIGTIAHTQCPNPQFSAWTLVLGLGSTEGAALPCVSVICRTCGKVELFSAVILGLMDEEGKFTV